MFNSYQAAQDSSVLMENGSLASIHGVGMVDSKFTSRKIMQLRNVQHVPTVTRISLAAPFFVEMALSWF
jgi:hypothetical protein